MGIRSTNTSFEENLSMAHKLALEISKAGGCAYFVGGFVRDKILGIENDDIDIEVHRITPDTLNKILDSLGTRIAVGESFGIQGLSGYSIDIAMPRKEKVIGKGHKDFDILVDPFIGERDAALRRDFTINSLMENILTGEIVDNFGGINDIKNKVLKHVNKDTFIEDPLRVLRCAQFACRLGFDVDLDTKELCSKIDINSLSKERVEGELKKALTKGIKPSLFFEFLKDINKLDYWFYELIPLIDLMQEPKYHPEGDVFTHTMKVIDTASQFRDKVKNAYYFMTAALVHDLGKATTTEVIDGRIRAFGHEIEGKAIAKKFINRYSNERDLIRYCLNMVENHMRPNILASQNSSIKATNKMFDDSIEPIELIYMSISDLMGLKESNELFLIERLKIYNELMEKDYVTGDDLIHNGIYPGPNFSKILDYSHKLRLAGIKKEDALKQTISFSKKLGY